MSTHTDTMNTDIDINDYTGERRHALDIGQHIVTADDANNADWETINTNRQKAFPVAERVSWEQATIHVDGTTSTHREYGVVTGYDNYGGRSLCILVMPENPDAHYPGFKGFSFSGTSHDLRLAPLMRVTVVMIDADGCSYTQTHPATPEWLESVRESAENMSALAYHSPEVFVDVQGYNRIGGVYGKISTNAPGPVHIADFDARVTPVTRDDVAEYGRHAVNKDMSYDGNLGTLYDGWSDVATLLGAVDYVGTARHAL